MTNRGSRDLPRHAEWRPDEDEARHPGGGVEREDRADEAPERGADEGGGLELQRVEDLAEERSRHVLELGVGIVERVRQPVAREIDGDHTVPGGERPKDRRPQRGVVHEAVDEHERRAVPELEHACLPPRPAHPPRACAGRKPVEDGRLRSLEPPVEVVPLHDHPPSGSMFLFARNRFPGS